MNEKRRVLMFFLLTGALAAILAGCKPIDYYFQRVYKAAGTVSDASTGAGLESVEVFLHPYQYSVLTNGLGDYGIELAEGTWTLDFVRAGYVTVTREVTVNETTPRVRVDVALTREAGPEQGWTFIGTWVNDAYDGGHGTPTAPPAKWVMTESTFQSYDYVADTEPMSTFPVNVTGDWTAAGWHYFRATVDAGGMIVYFLIGLSGPDTLQLSASPADYPTSLETSLSYMRQ